MPFAWDWAADWGVSPESATVKVGGSPEVPSVSARPNRDLVCQAAAWHACFDLSMHASSVAVHWRLAGHASGMLTSSIHTCRERVLLCSGVEGCTTRPTFADIGKEAACCCEHKQEGTLMCAAAAAFTKHAGTVGVMAAAHVDHALLLVLATVCRPLAQFAKGGLRGAALCAGAKHKPLTP